MEPPIAMSSVIAFSKLSKFAMPRGVAVTSSSSYQRRASSTMVRPARRKSSLRPVWVASIEPLPGSARTSASARQFIELAVNMPEQEPQVGQALSSVAFESASETSGLTAFIIASTRSTLRSVPLSTTLPASIGPPLTKMAGMLRRIAAISMPGVILSQLEMQITASAQWALHMYSTESAMISRLGRL